MERQELTWQWIDQACDRLAINILRDGWVPDYIVGITRGGLTPGVILSQNLKVPMYTLKVSLRDGGDEDCDHNLWMAEDAFGYGSAGCLEDPKSNILIVDDINDSGATIGWIKKDWPASCLPNSPEWGEIWHHNVKFAVLVNNLSSTETVDYYAMEINKKERDVWIDFPWER